MRKVLLVLISVSVVILADMSRSNAGVVSDSLTELEWQDDYSDNGNTIKVANWQTAITYCESIVLDSGNWRLPNINELLSIVDYKRYDPAIDISVFQNTASDYYWSSTTEAYFNPFLPNERWFVNFDAGDSHNFSYGSHTFYVRCVRSRQ